MELSTNASTTMMVCDIKSGANVMPTADGIERHGLPADLIGHVIIGTEDTANDGIVEICVGSTSHDVVSTIEVPAEIAAVAFRTFDDFSGLDPVAVSCYWRHELWCDRTLAIEFFAERARYSEGPERDRFWNVLDGLMCGLSEVSDR